MPNPLLNTGTSAMLFGLIFCTSNDAPMGVIPATPVSWVVRKVPNASTARNSEISWTSALVSFGDVLAERSCESFASRQGWVETCTLEGREDMISYVGWWSGGYEGRRERREVDVFVGQAGQHRQLPHHCNRPRGTPHHLVQLSAHGRVPAPPTHYIHCLPRSVL